LDPDAIWNGKWGQSRDGYNKRGGDRRRGSGILGVNVGHSTVSNGDDDMLFPNYFGEGFVTYY